MAKFSGTIGSVNTSWDDLSRRWPTGHVLKFTTTGPRTVPVGKSGWFHFFFKKKENSIQKSGKISLFGEFDDQGNFTLTDAKRFEDLEAYIRKALKPIGRDEWETDIFLNVPREHCIKHTIADPMDAIVKGRIFVIHTYWIGSFLAKNDWANIKNLAEYFADENSHLETSEFIDVTSRETELIDSGDLFSVFKKRLHKDRTRSKTNLNWLTKKTFLYEDKGEAKHYYFRLSRNGVIEVREEYSIKSLVSENNQLRRKDSNVKQLLETLLRYRPNPNPNSATEDLPLSVVRKFTKHLLKKYNAYVDGKTKLTNVQRSRAGKSYSISECKEVDWVPRERQRYSVVLLNKIECGVDGCDSSVSDYRQVLTEAVVQNLLEGTMVYREDSKQLLAPELPVKPKISIPDKSTWADEICKFGTERCLIFFEPKTVMENKGLIINYEDFWRCIVRGIEHVISVRTSLHILETATAEQMRKIPQLVQDTKDFDTDFEKLSSKISLITENSLANLENSRTKIKTELIELTEGVATLIQYLPALREVSVAASSFRALHAVDKFHHLQHDIFNFSEVLRHIQLNIDELTNFMQFFKQKQLLIGQQLASFGSSIDAKRDADSERRTARYLSLLGLLLAVLAAFYSAPSFIEAFSKNFVVRHYGDIPQDIDLVASSFWFHLGFSLITSLGTALYWYFYLRRTAVTTLDENAEDRRNYRAWIVLIVINIVAYVILLVLGIKSFNLWK